MYCPCDYVMDTNKDFHFISSYFHEENKLFAVKVFEVNEAGGRFNQNGLRYKKVVEDNMGSVLLSTIEEHLSPKNSSNLKLNLDGIWRKIYHGIRSLGIPDDDIGIFGSSLIGFPITKDVDFIIYGLDNIPKLKNNITQLRSMLGVAPISEDHIRYQSKKYSRNHDPTYTNFERLLRNKWSSLQISEGVLTTIRFSLRPTEISKQFMVSPDTSGEPISLEGRVIDDSLVDIRPRIFTIEQNRKEYTVLTYYWAYQSCVRKDDLVRIEGESINDKIILNKYNHGVWLK
jgi:predicted nucleotidyltransferase